MITVQKFQTLGEMKARWLHARYHFSFAMYHNPARMGFGNLRVINDDRIKAGEGFGMHPHDNMEIITYVRKGAIIHRDSLGNHGVTKAGDVQVMSAGTGITHSEASSPDEDTTLYQIWIEPNARQVTPRWEAAEFPEAFVNDKLNLLVSGSKDDVKAGSLYIHADATIHGGRLRAGMQLKHETSGSAYVLVSAGSVTINGTALQVGDGAEIRGENSLAITALEDAEILVIDVGPVH